MAAEIQRSGSLEARLELGELVYFQTSPFALPNADDNGFLRDIRLGRLSKNVSYELATDRVGGYTQQSPEHLARLKIIFRAFSETVIDWVATTLPAYRGGCRPDRMSYRPEEEATRSLRPTARNDLLHVDAFPNRPARDHRILRVFANINPSEPRIWVTSENFAKLLERYGKACGLPGDQTSGWLKQIAGQWLAALKPATRRRTVCDAFMLRFHDYLKANDHFQERAPKKLWTFPPNSAWIVMTDACSHAVLRGRFALEHSFFVSPNVLVRPEQTPAALLAQAMSPSAAIQPALPTRRAA